MFAFGALIFCVMVLIAVEVHPLAPVTVTVYVPGVFTDTEALVPMIAVPFDQEYEVPPVAVKVILVTVHVKILVAGGIIAASGGAMF
jgi:hypothetical protein